jgi:glycosyltransferase involved in cell wall biosynthesis
VILLVTSEIPPDRVAPFRALASRVPLTVARFGGERKHATAGVEAPGVTVVDVSERDVQALARRADAVIAGTVGRVALPAAYLGARRGGHPFVLWTALWAHPRTPAHALSLPLLRHLYRHADAVATYGEHVSAYVRARGARNVHVAPQAVDPAFWGAARQAPEPERFTALFVGRPAPEKGLHVLRAAWDLAGIDGELRVVGEHGPVSPEDVRNSMDASSVLVIPSIATRAFREPWALVANEALHRGLPVIATDAVGAVAGGLVRHERNGLVVPAGDAKQLAAALGRLAHDPDLRRALGSSGTRDVSGFTPEAWAGGMVGALRSTGVTC